MTSPRLVATILTTLMFCLVLTALLIHQSLLAKFPALCPVRRTLTPGNYATKRFTAVSGAGRTRLYGSKAFDATLNLEYLLNDNELSLLLASYHNSRGSYRALTLHPEVFAGIDPVVLAQIPSYLSWRWADTPVVNSLLPGRSRVQVNLVATLDD